MNKLLGSTAGVLILAATMGLAQAATVVNEPTTVYTQGSIVRNPTDLPAPITRTAPATINVHLTALERVAPLDDGTTYDYWTFDGKVPGPMIRARVGDTIHLTLTNPASSTMAHSIDLHAVTGPGGGSKATAVMPGESKSFTFKALHAGLFVYHCATRMVAEHISNGMYGMILIQPKKPLPKVDHEFYVMQGELYTNEPYGTKGELSVDYDKLINEQPTYMTFNGKVGALTKDDPLKAKVGDTARIYFGVGGPNKTSSYHVIGESFDTVYNEGSFATENHNVQTVTVAPGSATVTDLSFQVPGTYIIVDHALSRLEKGLAGYIKVKGPADPAIFNVNPGKAKEQAEAN